MRLIIDRDIPVEMRDGTVLRADVYRPESDDKWPVLLQRTPYDKNAPRISALLLNPIRAASAGYAVVVQDVRGRFASDGEFYTFRHEPDDGYDTIAWAAAQPWSAGQVGMFGLSYVGATQWLAAITTPPALATIIPVVTASDYYEGWAYQGGAFELGFNASWTLSNLAFATLVRRLKAGEPFPLWATSNVFKAGHCIRLEISSSNFPRFDRNPNTGGALAIETEIVPAIQTVYHDGTYASHVTLPIIPRA